MREQEGGGGGGGGEEEEEEEEEEASQPTPRGFSVPAPHGHLQAMRRAPLPLDAPLPKFILFFPVAAWASAADRGSSPLLIFSAHAVLWRKVLVGWFP